MPETLSTQPNISERPRERLIRHGTDALTSAELLSVILGTGLPGTPVLDFAHGLLKRFGGVRGLLAASSEELRCVPGIGTARVCSLAAILALARRAKRIWRGTVCWITRRGSNLIARRCLGMSRLSGVWRSSWITSTG